MGARSGNNYLSSLKKLGAEIWIAGAPVGDVTAHPAFANCAARSRRSTTCRWSIPRR